MICTHLNAEISYYINEKSRSGSTLYKITEFYYRANFWGLEGKRKRSLQLWVDVRTKMRGYTKAEEQAGV